jgi:Rrf2 family protein
MFYMPTKIQYGLYLLITLAKNDRRMSLKEVAGKGKMPYRFLTKIVQDLVKAKLIEAKEGKGGGYTLAKKPSAIRIKTVLEALGEQLEITRCLGGEFCSSQKTCKLKPVWTRIKRYVDKEMNQVTLKDLI